MNDEPLSNEFTVDPVELQADLNKLKELKKASSEKSGDLGAHKTALVDRQGYHKAALDMCLKIDTMSETNQADFLRTFRPMFAAMLPTWEHVDMLDELND